MKDHFALLAARTIPHRVIPKTCLAMLFACSLSLTGRAQSATTNLVTGTIAVSGQRDAYVFNVSTNARFYFDALTNSSSLEWSLTGPEGAVVTSRSFGSSDAQTIGDSTLSLVPGDYTITIQSSGSTTNGYGFRFINLADATLLTPGTLVSNSLAPANRTDLYQFTANAGDLFYFHQVSRVGLPNTWWRLMDPYDNQVFSQGFNDVGTAIAPVSLRAAGTYTLMIEGYIGDTGSGSYAFNVVPEGNTPPSPFTGTPMNLGDLIAGDLSANTTNSYTFTLATAARIIFDPLTNNSSLTLSLEGPPGTIVNQRAINTSGGIYGYGPFNLPAGDYQLRVQGTVANAYRFRMLDLATANPLTIATIVTNVLNPASAASMYRFDAPAGSKFFFDSLTQSGMPNAYWRLVDPNNVVLFLTTAANNQGPLTLPVTGTYTLLVEGYWGDSGSGTTTFKVVPITDGLQALTIGNLVSGNIALPGQRQQYTFSIGSAARLYFDSLTNYSALRWSLDGPTGNVVNSRTFNSSDAQNIGNPILTLVPGNYTLTVSASGDNTSAYQFRLFDLTSAGPLTLGTTVNGTLNPANSTVAYQFTLASPTKVLYDYLSSSALNNTYVRLLDANGNVPISTSLNNVVGPLMLPAGSYTLLVEGYIGDTGNGSYSFNLNPVTDGSQSLTIGSLVSGSIASSGQRQQYTFSLGAAARLYFDSLTNYSSLRWSLDGPTGNVINNRTFSSSDAQSVGNPILALVPGDYTLTVSANSDTTSAYQFRLFDIASATALTPGAVVNGTLNPANSTVAYHFTLASPTKVLYDSLSAIGLPNAYVRLLDANGNVPISTSLNNVVGPLLLPAGSYTLLVEGYIGDTGNGSYSFNLNPVTDGSQSLTLGNVVSGSIASPGQRQQYTFSLGSAARLYFDSLTNYSALRWSLDGPTGNVINNRTFNSSDAQSVGNPILALVPGNYTITVSASSDSTSAFQFRLFDLTSAAPLTLGTTVNGTLNPANSTIAYQFTLASPTKVLYDYLSSIALPNAHVRLLDGNGNVPISTSLNNIVGPLLLPAGSYTFLVEGYIGDTGNGSYSFDLNPVTDGSQSLTLGNVVSGSIASPGQSQQYTFSLSSAARLYFDSLINNSSLRWSLDGPAGNLVNNRTFNGSDAQSIGNPLLALAPGNYTMTISASSDNTGPYLFRVLDLASATPIALGTVISSNSFAANSTELFQFNVATGDQISFHYQSSSGLPNGYRRLIDPYNNIIFAQSLNSGSITTNRLLAAGTYTLLIEGYIGDTGSASYSFFVESEGNLPIVPFTGTPLTIGAPVSGILPSNTATTNYVFTLPAPKRLYFDALTNASFAWSLIGPAGTIINNRGFINSDGADIADPALVLPAGDYQLNITSLAGEYRFNLLDYSNTLPMTPGIVVSNSLAPANSAVFYQFNGTAGQQLYFNGLGGSGFTYQPYCRLYGPLGNIVMAQNVNSDVDTFTLQQSGAYTLTVEGRVYDTHASGNYSLNLIPITYPTNTLTIGQTINNTLSTPGQRQSYTFTLASAARLYFDAMTNGNFTWRLDAPWGQVVDWRSFLSSDGADISDPALALPAGAYTLTVAGSSFSTTGNYQFRLLDLTIAAPMIPGIVVSNSLAPANSAVFYQFTGTAGQQLYFNGLGGSGFTYQPYCRLYGPLGNIVMAQNVNSDADTFTLQQSGAYTLTVEGRVYDTHASGNYSLNLIPITYPTNALTIGQTINNTLSTPGQRQSYTFTLASAARLYFDAMTNGSFNWRLDAPWGQVVDWRSFLSSDGADISDPALALPAGAYTLTVAGSSFSTTGNYQFRLLDLTIAAPMIPGIVVSNSLAPANSAVFYQFTGTAGQQLYFNGLGGSGFTYQPYCRLYGPLGNIVMAQNVNSDVDTFTLQQSGAYTLTVEGRVYDTHASGNYSLNLIPITYPTNALTIGQTVSINLATPGQRQFYTFTLASAARLYFDAMTNGNFNWRLDAPYGQVVNWRSFLSSDSADIGDPALPLPAGTYTLTVAGSGFTTTGDFQFRLLDLSTAALMTPGVAVSNSLVPANSTVFYQFNGSAGDHYYFNGQGGSGFSYQPYCRLYGPLGNILFGQYINSDVDTFVLPQSGNYTLTVEGRVYDTHATGNFAFNLAPNPLVIPQQLFPTNVSPDLIVSSVTVSPSAGLLSGGSTTVFWTDRNTGNGPTSGSFTDRVTVRNAANQVVADTFLPYNEADLGNGPIGSGAARDRQTVIQFPDGTNTIGTLQVTVTVDAQNGIAESNEANNSASTNISVGLAPYPDLQIAGISPAPPTAWLPSSTVSINWQITNSGNGFAATNWTDSVVIRNTNTSAVILSTTTNYNLSDSGNGAIAPADFRNRFLSFTMPSGVNAYGVFAVTVTADSANNVFEYNAGGSAELNNSMTFNVISAPDLVPTGLALSPAGPVLSGDTITINWNDMNAGSVDAGLPFYDRVTVVNTNTGETLLNTTLYYDPAALGNSPIAPGASRARTTKVQLPDGQRGVGALLVTVALDTFGQIPEFNVGNTAEANNTSTTGTTSTIADYPDLQVANLGVQPLIFNSGTNIIVQWQDTNSGNGIAPGSWYDHVTISNATVGVALLDIQVYYDALVSGPLTNGMVVNRSANFTLPNGANGAGTLRVSVTADYYNNIFEYNPAGSAETNNFTTITAVSGIAAYPDLQVTALNVQPVTLGSGTNLTATWQDTNSGTASASASWYDHLVISNATLGVTLLDTTLLYDRNALGVLTNGGAATRAFNFTLPYSSNGAGGLVFTVTADYFNNIFEYNSDGTGENNNTASISRSSTLTPLPDLVVTSLTTTNTALTSQIISAKLRVVNQGLLPATGDMLQQVFLSSSPVAGSGILSAIADYNGTLDAGQALNQTVTLLTPSIPGTYWLSAVADGNNNILELSENNNSLLASTPLNVQAAYTASIVADVHSALANTPIPMHGHAYLGGSGLPAVSVPVTIHIQVRGTDRTVTVLTAADGSFTNLFQPLPNEAGVYQISAALPAVANPPAQDSFTLIGMSIAPVSLVDLTDGTSITNTTIINNLSDIPLTGLSVTVATNQPNLTVTASISTNTLSGFANASLTFTIQALNASIFQSPVILHVASAEGATADLTFLVRVEALRPNLVITPSSLTGAMQRGAQTPVSFSVANQGGVATGPLQVAIPNTPWLSLASSNQLPPLAPGSNTVITILLTPASDLPFGNYNGTLVVASTNSAAQIPFSFRAVSDATGNLLVTAEDEYTYFAPGSPHVTNALVTVSDALTGVTVATNRTGADGITLFTNLTEAYYVVTVSADKHSPFRQSLLVPAVTTTNLAAFLTRQTVTYSFTVTPTTVPDQYTFSIDSTFETQVPVPVLTIEPASLDLSQYPGTQFQVMYTIANHGLIDAESVNLVFPSSSWVQMTALVTNLGKLKANTSYTIPVLVTRLGPSAHSAAPAGNTLNTPPPDAGSGTCSVTGQMLWNYLCGPNVVDKSTAYYAFDSTGCNLVDLYQQVYHLEPDPGTGGGGGGLITSDEFFDYLRQFQNVTDFEAPPGYHFACNASPPPTSKRLPLNYTPSGGSTSSCAKVSIRLDQKGVLTRDAFNATLDINNDVTSPLQNVQASIQITDLNGNVVNTNFAISLPALSGLSGVDGTGNLPGNTQGSSTWTLIPTLDAAPTNGMTLYLVGGSLSYVQDGTPVNVPLAPAPIQVFPQPELLVRYFHERNVYADDPFTPQIEPSVPYSLAVQVNNVGFGAARSLSISGGKPQIVDNIKGLLINFNILGTQLENQQVTPALNVDFGSINPGTNKTARWLFTSSVQGSFTNFSASFAQVDSFGKPRLSLVRGVEVHELTHIVDAGGPFEDSRPDFLVNDTYDPNFLPDMLYLSDGSIMPVTPVTNAIIAGTLSSTSLTVTVSASVPLGWTYLQFGDPGPGQYQLAHILRADNSEVPFGTNAWTTDRSFIGGDVLPIHTNLVHLLDYNSSGEYTLVYVPVVTNSVDTTAPTSTVAALPASSPSSFTVQWSGTDNIGGSGVALFSVYASTNGGPFGPWVTNTALSAALFTGTSGNTYAFFSRATDMAGNQEATHLTADTQTSTTAPANTPPAITAITTQTVTAGDLFSYNPGATDTDPTTIFSWSLLPGAPAGALISPTSGHMTWQTSAGDAGTTNHFALVVSDNGSPSLTSTQAFDVVVIQLNHSPTIAAIPPQISVTEETALSLQLSATDPDLPQQTLTWQINGAKPTGLTLDAGTGLLSWTPTQAQAPSTNVITVVVSDSGTPVMSDTKTFSIVVNAVNHAPVLTAISNQFASVLLALTITNTATDSDHPAQLLTFSLDPGAPTGANIRTNGVFSWSPNRSQAGTTNVITVRVTDNGFPAMSDTKTFTVVVGDYLEAILGSAIIQAGQTGGVAIVMHSTTPVTNLNINIQATPGLTNFTMTDPIPALGLATVQQTGPNAFQASFGALSGQTLSGTQTLSTLIFQARSDTPSCFIPLQITGVTANQANGVAVPRTLSASGRVVVVNNNPLLEALITGGEFQLSLFAPPGPSYTLESTPSLIPPLTWSPFFTTNVGTNLLQVIPLPATNPRVFFRAKSP